MWKCNECGHEDDKIVSSGDSSNAPECIKCRSSKVERVSPIFDYDINPEILSYFMNIDTKNINLCQYKVNDLPNKTIDFRTIGQIISDSISMREVYKAVLKKYNITLNEPIALLPFDDNGLTKWYVYKINTKTRIGMEVDENLALIRFLELEISEKYKGTNINGIWIHNKIGENDE